MDRLEELSLECSENMINAGVLTRLRRLRILAVDNAGLLSGPGRISGLTALDIRRIVHVDDFGFLDRFPKLRRLTLSATAALSALSKLGGLRGLRDLVIVGSLSKAQEYQVTALLGSRRPNLRITFLLL